MASDFSRTLALLRKEKKISQRIAASDLEVSQALLSHYENGLREPGLPFVVRAADYYGVSCDYMLGRSMARDGSALPPDKISAGAQSAGGETESQNKRLLKNSIDVLLSLTEAAGSRQLTEEAVLYLSVAVYRLFRYLYMADLRNPPQTFRFGAEYFEKLCDAQSKLAELRIKSILSGDGGFGVQQEYVTLPDLTLEKISEGYPESAREFLTLLQAVSDRLSEIFQKD